MLRLRSARILPISVCFSPLTFHVGIAQRPLCSDVEKDAMTTAGSCTTRGAEASMEMFKDGAAREQTSAVEDGFFSAVVLGTAVEVVAVAVVAFFFEVVISLVLTVGASARIVSTTKVLVGVVVSIMVAAVLAPIIVVL